MRGGCWGSEEVRKSRRRRREEKKATVSHSGHIFMLTVAGIRLFVGVVGQLGETRDCGWIWARLDAHGSAHVDLTCPWQGRTTLALFFFGGGDKVHTLLYYWHMV